MCEVFITSGCYKPTGADKYRVIYADLSVKKMAPEDVQKLPEAQAE
jgi:hypothetical protein